NAEVGDRANDAFRINGCELRCKVVGEGGNLGFTQKGRIEYAINGGRINSDAMDNSAGVDCYDHEVNIKIALTQAMRAKKITFEQRNKVLESMTDEVSDLVLKDNNLQTQAITIAQSQGLSALAAQGQFLSKLEKIGLLNRKIEFLPSNKDITKRYVEKTAMTRPELCVMLAYAKMEIYSELLSSKLLDDQYFEEELCDYFPRLMQKKFADEIKTHQLRREIIATQITNFVVNHAGITFINQIVQESGFKVSEVVKCLIIAVDSFGLRKVWQDIENLGSEVAHHVQSSMFLGANKLLERSVLWLLRNNQNGDLAKIVVKFKKIATELFDILPQVMAKDSSSSYSKKYDFYSLNNISESLSAKVAAMDPIASTFDIAEISEKSKFDLKTIAKIYFLIGTRFSLKWLRVTLGEMPFDAYWQRLAAKTLIEDFYIYQMKIAKQIVDENCDKPSCSTNAVEEWISQVGFLMERYDNFIAELKTSASVDMSMFVVALNRLKPLV
ncbi:MAG TPA: NAD-glutamate dehydrogenase domain-containing protein, partial [Rickettsiales bacterium]|nr:NAD-glutamate dehydrogenase domain-containing protein [Rickettsiales bacterium]